MSEEDGAEKSHDPTPNKLKEARKKGEIPKSNDLTTALSYLGLAIALLSLGRPAIMALGDRLAGLLSRLDTLPARVFSGQETAIAGAVLWSGATLLLALLAIPVALVLLSLVVQQALLFTPSKLNFKLNRLSLISNAKQKFGRSGLFEFFKSFVKLAVYSAILAVFLQKNASDIVYSSLLSPAQSVAKLGALLVRLLSIVVVVALTIGIIDLVWQRAEHIRKNRMSRKELMDEMKNTEGDPEMKGKRRQKGQEIALNQMLAAVPDAEVVIVNPTHFAVALSWDRSQAQPPVCVAKGVDETAARIREAAQEAGVPIHSDPPTARALYADVEIGAAIDSEHFMAVAAAIRFADNLRRKARAR